ncbi:hypothetical protein K1719_020253 [Acacia pycnantha]|nr:hypothetical protein K1719_020253 [Acacia pycnantha]
MIVTHMLNLLPFILFGASLTLCYSPASLQSLLSIMGCILAPVAEHTGASLDLNQLCKSQLKNYDPCMKATSSVEGQLFERPDFLSTSKEAEQVAANVALMSLSLDNSHKARMVLISANSFVDTL